MNDKVLIVDDDDAVLKTLSKVIEGNGFLFDTASSGEDALMKIKENNYSLCLLDVNLGGIDGFGVIEKVREMKNSLPIIVVSGRKEDGDTLHGLEIGADDYITKPFNPVTLGAKVKALIRRSKTGSSSGSEIKAGPFEYNTSTLRLFKNGNEIILSGKENAIMKLFLDNVGKIFSKDTIYEMVWGDTLIDENAIMVYINRLRQKIEDEPDKPFFIRNVRGIGYKFVI